MIPTLDLTKDTVFPRIIAEEGGGGGGVKQELHASPHIEHTPLLSYPYIHIWSCPIHIRVCGPADRQTDMFVYLESYTINIHRL